MFGPCLFVASCLMWIGLDALPASNENITNISTCMEFEFRCNNNQCIPREMTCDAEPNCDDGSDEDEKMCEERECYPEAPFKCERTGTCLPKNLTCNGHEDCIFGEDEGVALCQPDLPPPTFDIHIPGNSDEASVEATRVRRAAVADSIRHVFNKILVENLRPIKKPKKTFKLPPNRSKPLNRRMPKIPPYKRPPPGPVRIPDPTKIDEYK